jgi:hypothetical protein
MHPLPSTEGETPQELLRLLGEIYAEDRVQIMLYPDFLSDLAARLDLLDKTYAFLCANELELLAVSNDELKEEYISLIHEYLAMSPSQEEDADE